MSILMALYESNKILTRNLICNLSTDGVQFDINSTLESNWTLKYLEILQLSPLIKFRKCRITRSAMSNYTNSAFFPIYFSLFLLLQWLAALPPSDRCPAVELIHHNWCQLICYNWYLLMQWTTFIYFLLHHINLTSSPTDRNSRPYTYK